MRDALDKADSVTSSVISVIQDQLGPGAFEDIINCKFLAVDAGTIVTTFQPVGNVLIQVAALLTALGLCNWIVVFFGFIYLERKITAAESSGHTVLQKDN